MTARENDSGVHVALLRGVNLGGKSRLPMKELATLFGGVGCAEIRTYIQSGNVVFRAEAEFVDRVPALVVEAIARDFGFKSPVVLRTAAELAAAVRHNPFLEEGADPKTLHVGFLLAEPDDSRVATLDPERSPPDRFVVRGREVYLHCPNGLGRSKLTTQYFDSRLKTTMTVRNWTTVTTLLAMAGAS